MDTQTANSGISRRKFLISGLILLCAMPKLRAASVMGVEYVSLAQVAKSCGMSLKIVVAGKVANIYSQYTKIDFELHKKDIYINGNRLYLGFPIASVAGHLHMAQSDFYKNIVAILFPKKPKFSLALSHIILDAGHGGKDFGAINKKLGINEKTFALDMAKRLGAMLTSYGFKVSYTRSTDVFIPLENRYLLANKLKGDMFISLHFNATTATSVSGVETFSMTPSGQYSTTASKITDSCKKTYPANKYDEWNKLLNYCVNTSLRNATKAIDRGSKNARFTVLTGALMPSILVEGGFLTNDTEALKIKSSAYRDTLARAILAGIIKYQKTASRIARS
ncbi:MAG: N-acetylmuramoyl-L-alanine amidase [Opitutales bacterium]